MQSIILAAGVGKRLSSLHTDPKILLEVGGVSLLERTIVNLLGLGVEKIIICLGYKQELVIQAIKQLGLKNVSIVSNREYHLGSTVSLWQTKEEVLKKQDTLLLDADVLYHPKILQILCESKSPNCLLIDRNFDDGDEPVKVCVSNNKITEFRKILSPDLQYDVISESVGFFKFSTDGIASIFDRCEKYILGNRKEAPHEEVIRDCIIYNELEIKYEDITGYPWIEIDFPEDVEKARQEIVTQIPSTGTLDDLQM